MVFSSSVFIFMFLPITFFTYFILNHLKFKLLPKIFLITASLFFIQNLNSIFYTQIPLLNLMLPLALSFVTFQQIAFLCDTYERERERE